VTQSRVDKTVRRCYRLATTAWDADSPPWFDAPMDNPRLSWLTWPPAEVAAVLLPWFSSEPYHVEIWARLKIADWLTTGSHDGKTRDRARETEVFTQPEIAAVAEAIQLLEHAGLLIRAISENTTVGLTRLGRHALQTKTVRQRLGLQEASPSM
jgi:hypothetical protein